MDEDEKFQIIDIDKVFKEKNPGLYKWIPGFVMSYFKRVIHQKEMNAILKKSVGIKEIDFAKQVIKELGVTIKFRGLQNIPSSGPVIIAGNHPLGGLDGVALISAVGSIRKDVRFIVNDILTNLTNFGEVFIPVNKLGSNAKSNLERIEKIYASDMAVLIFPAGLCSRKIDGEIKDLPWQKSFVSKAQKYVHPIVPVFVIARNSNWFYNLSKFRTSIGLKANIEMFWLVDEMFKQKGKTIEFIVGKPILPEYLSPDINQKEWTEKIRAYIYNLINEPDISFEDFLKSRIK
jgi:putative hemolysin